ncbi:alpha/beta fold hydrolase [Conexibacter sp. JD483]|uniref:alpha/beta fold hydrolase n=1 Tax=unclassified Conexibacter TaxID=2627773 RepID=UPI00271B2FED|nr:MULTISPECIES: alpha/beta fold hydrolase [unclassified Conexibacter]MDO8187344.1 alpha/beta fold hydrolase [Conexibacter sp. CPCC 205706]MDO8200523.1 alpha/beta fold hydrolase [Conexibacter sp. CPCC 205762]MDR9370008.1 alpha/beta fold hydrolase [Conexibacter sp. JD483]
MTTLHVERRGAGAPLLLISGHGGTTASWPEPFLTALAREFDCIAYDHRSIGASPSLPGPFTLADLADDAAELLDELGLADAHVFGPSMGGMVAQQLALRHPRRIRTLALGCTYCGGPGAALVSQQEWQPVADAIAAGDTEARLRATWELGFSPAHRADPARFDAYRAAAAAHRPSTRDVETFLAQDRAIDAFDVQAQLPRIAAPTLVIHGDADRMIPLANGRLIASRIPGARLTVLADVGHDFCSEQPAASAALLRGHARG